MVTEAADSITGRWDDVSHFFGLSYNPYLVVPRSLLQSMPAEWQKRFVDMLAEVCDTPAGEKWMEAHYYVQRTDPDRDAEIHEASIHNQSHDDDEQEEVPAIKVIDDPFRNYRHPSRDLFPALSGHRP